MLLRAVSTVSDDDTAGPVIMLGGSQNYGERRPEPGRSPGMSPTRPGSRRQRGHHAGRQRPNSQLGDAAGSFDFNTYGLGAYEITVNATDNDGDCPGDTTSSSDMRSVTVEDDDTAGPAIVLGGSQDAETDAPPIISRGTWRRLRPVRGDVTITKDGRPLFLVGRQRQLRL